MQSLSQLEQRIIDLENNLIDLDFIMRDHNKKLQNIINDLAQIQIKQMQMQTEIFDFAKQIKEIQKNDHK